MNSIDSGKDTSIEVFKSVLSFNKFIKKGHMLIGILGTGIVGTTLAEHLVGKGHEVMMGSINNRHTHAKSARQKGKHVENWKF